MISPPLPSHRDLLVESGRRAPEVGRDVDPSRSGAEESASFTEVLTQLTADETAAGRNGAPGEPVRQPAEQRVSDPHAPPPDPQTTAPAHDEVAQELPIGADASASKACAEQGPTIPGEDQHAAPQKVRPKREPHDHAAPVPRRHPRERSAPIEAHLTAPPRGSADAEGGAPPHREPETSPGHTLEAGGTAESGPARESGQATVPPAAPVIPPLHVPTAQRHSGARRPQPQPRPGASEGPAAGEVVPAVKPTARTQAEAKPASEPSTGAPPPAAPPTFSSPAAPATTFLELQPAPAPRAGGLGAAPAPPSSGSPNLPALNSAGADLSPQIVRGAMALTRTTGGSLTMRLEPDSLGSLRIQMSLSQGRVAVQFHAESAQARGLLSQHVEALRTAMETQGLKLETVQVHSLSRPSTGGGQETGHQQHQPTGGEQGARQDAAGQQSRGHADTAEREAQYRQAARQHAQQQREGGTWREQWSAASASPASNAASPHAHALRPD